MPIPLTIKLVFVIAVGIRFAKMYVKLFIKQRISLKFYKFPSVASELSDWEQFVTIHSYCKLYSTSD